MDARADIVHGPLTSVDATRLVLAPNFYAITSYERIIFVVFKFQSVTVPDVAARVVLEPYDDPRDHARVGAQVKGCAKG